MDYSKLETGQNLPTHKQVMSCDAVRKYIDAVDDVYPLYNSNTGKQLVPPTAIAAFAIQGVLKDLCIPGGTIHVSQELSFLCSVEVGQELSCRATLAKNFVRGQWRFISIDISVSNTSDIEVIKGKSSIMIPV